MTQPGSSESSDAAARLSQDAADLIHAEVQSVRDDATALARRAGASAVLFGGAGVCGCLAVATGSTTLLRGLETMMPRGRAALALTGLYAAGAVGLAVAGTRALAKARAAGEDAVRAAGEPLQP